MELTQLAACFDALWGLDTHGRVNIRTLSPSCPFGLHWTPLDLNQLGMFLSHRMRRDREKSLFLRGFDGRLNGPLKLDCLTSELP